AGISSRFFNVNDIDSALNESLADIGTLCKASRAYLFRLSADGSEMSNTHEWCSENVESQIGLLQHLPIISFSWWMGKLKNGDIIRINNPSELPPEAASEKQLLELLGAKSVLALPIETKDDVAGFIGFDNIYGTNEWTENDLAVLRITKEIIGAAIERHEAQEELSKLNSQLFTLNT